MAAVDKRAIGVVREYFLHQGKESILAALDAEYGREGRPSNQDYKEFVSLLNGGNGKAFFALWEKKIPSAILEKDRTCRHLECSCQLHFAVYHHRHGNDPQGSLCRAAMELFSNYLANRGRSMAEFDDFQPFFALPYVPDPRRHKPYEDLFTDRWVTDLQARVGAFLKSALRPVQVPVLLKLLSGGAAAATADVPVANGAELEKLRMQMQECEERALLYIRRCTDAQTDYQSLLSIAMDLVEALQQTVSGNPVTADQIQLLCSRLFKANATMDSSRPIAAVDVLQSTLTDMKLQTEPHHSQIRPSLDYDKIKEQLPKLSHKDAALLFQALRLRLTQSSTSDQRNHVVRAYIEADILGCTKSGKFQEYIHRTLQSSKVELQESAVRLLNAFASIAAGRRYLSRHPSLVEILHSVLEKSDSESATTYCLVAALQKLSLLKSLQTRMIKCDMIKWLMNALADVDSMSEPTLHYTSALMMNLCLRTAGKLYCITDSHQILSVLSDQMEGDDLLIRSYINGSLYSLLTVPQIREQAREMGLGAFIEELQKTSPPHMASQLGYIINQLSSDDGMMDTNAESGDEEEEEEEDEVDNLDDIDRGDYLTPNADQPCGEDLLCKNYLVVFPAKAQQRARPRTGVNAQQFSELDRPLDRPVTPRHPHLLATSRDKTPPTGRAQKAKTMAAGSNVVKDNRRPAPLGAEQQQQQSHQRKQQPNAQQQHRQQPVQQQRRQQQQQPAQQQRKGASQPHPNPRPATDHCVTGDRAAAARHQGTRHGGTAAATTAASHGRPMTSSGLSTTSSGLSTTSSSSSSSSRQQEQQDSGTGVMGDSGTRYSPGHHSQAPRGRGYIRPIGRAHGTHGTHGDAAALKKPGTLASVPTQSMTAQTDANGQTIRLSYNAPAGSSSPSTGASEQQQRRQTADGASAASGAAQTALPSQQQQQQQEHHQMSYTAAGSSGQQPDEYKAAFASKPRIARTPDKSEAAVKRETLSTTPSATGMHDYSNLKVTVSKDGRLSKIPPTTGTDFYSASPPPSEFPGGDRSASPTGAAAAAARPGQGSSSPVLHDGAAVGQQRNTKPAAAAGPNHQAQASSGNQASTSSAAPRRSARNRSKAPSKT
eukprot:scpid50044/ scgid15102/ LisH domain-containing protein ARMC9; Melanoma/melanocyte-specific tumor antigen KU-MEL-1; NS21